jgi:GNAT superfamily N-acetyltransferase
MSYMDQISTLFDGKPVTISRARIESYMSKTEEEGRWVVTIDRVPAAAFTLICMPGCCGIVISTHCLVAPEFRRRGLGRLLNEMRVQMAYYFGYTLMLCTDVATNTPQQFILRRNDWNSLYTFINARTSNVIGLDAKLVQDTGIDLGFNP